MRRYLDDEDEEEDEPKPEQKRDRELTLGYLSLIGIFFGLVLLCALSYAIGYEVGRANGGPVLTLPPGIPTHASGTKPNASASHSAAAAPSETGSEAPAPAAEPASKARQVAQQAAQALLPVRTIPAPSPTHPQSSFSGGPYMVQITAVSNAEDGDLLLHALQKRGYQVTSRREGDGLIHIRMGPFSSRDDAGHWRQKLLDDGYPATLQ